MKLQQCEKCGEQAAEVDAVEQLRDIARILSITADTDANIREAVTGILNIAERLERGKQKWKSQPSKRITLYVR